jgi:hypothetical protein
MKIMVFLHGTAIMHRNALGRTRQERVRQVMDGDESVHDFASYIPVGNAVQKLQAWSAQGADLVYLSSHQSPDDVEKDKAVLQTYGFPEGPIFYRHAGETYAYTAESDLPDVLIEDDCESIGGEKQMTYPHIRPQLKAKVKSVAVKEFGGIDHLPDDISELMSC